MTESQKTFDRPYRPWFVKAFNSIGKISRRLGLEPELRMDRAMRNAKFSTGLKDFGNEDFLEPLELLFNEFRTSANLNPFGVLGISVILYQHLQNRLLLHAAWKRHPDFLQTPLRRPLYVVGMPRTGTTLLYNLLCQDPNARPLMVWETMYPAGTEKDDRRKNTLPRRKRASSVIRFTNRLVPNLKQIHAIEPDGPEECGWLMNNEFISQMFSLDGQLPRYFEYLNNLSDERMRSVYDFYLRTLQLLQQGDTSKHWILKSPVHQTTLLPLMDTIPEANIIQTHRDPLKVVPSCCSLVAMTRGVFTDDQDLSAVGPEIAERMALSLERAKRAENKYAERIVNVLFDDVVSDPLGTVRRIYARFNYSYSDEMEAGMKRWLADNPQGKHGAHKYDPEQFGLSSANLKQMFSQYHPEAYRS